MSSNSACLAGHRLGAVVLGKSRRNGLAIAGRHADQRLLDLRQDAVRADRDLHALALAARKHRAIDATLVIDRHPIALLRRALHQREDRALRAHALEHRVDVLFGHLRRRAARSAIASSGLSVTSGSTSNIAA